MERAEVSKSILALLWKSFLEIFGVWPRNGGRGSMVFMCLFCFILGSPLAFYDFCGCTQITRAQLCVFLLSSGQLRLRFSGFALRERKRGCSPGVRSATPTPKGLHPDNTNSTLQLSAFSWAQPPLRRNIPGSTLDRGVRPAGIPQGGPKEYELSSLALLFCRNRSTET